MSTKCFEVIVTEDTLRGSGLDGDPVRRVTQVFTKDGELLAERDPALRHCLLRFTEKMSAEELTDFNHAIRHLP